MFQSFKQHCIDFYLTTFFTKLYHMISFFWCSTSKHVILFYVICLFVSSFYLMIFYLFYHISNYCIFCYTPQIILLGIGIVRFHSFQISWIDMLASQLSFSGRAPRLNLPPLPGGQSLARLGALKNQIENQRLGQSQNCKRFEFDCSVWGKWPPQPALQADLRLMLRHHNPLWDHPLLQRP